MAAASFGLPPPEPLQLQQGNTAHSTEKFKARIVAGPMSKTKAMCVVCNEAIDILSMGEAALQSHMIDKKLMELKLLSPSVTHFLSSS